MNKIYRKTNGSGTKEFVMINEEKKVLISLKIIILELIEAAGFIVHVVVSSIIIF